MWFVFQDESINMLEREEGHSYKSFHKMDRRCSSKMRDAVFTAPEKSLTLKPIFKYPRSVKMDLLVSRIEKMSFGNRQDLWRCKERITV